MAIRQIITDQDHKALRGKAKRVRHIDTSTRQLIDDLLDTMRVAPGVGLAAPQIGVPLRVIVVEYEDQRFTVINPEIVKRSGSATDEEGCLSAPHWQGPVTRATTLTLKGRDRDGKDLRIKADGWLARIFQHEIDHLEGVLFLDLVQDRSQIHWVDSDAGGEAEGGEGGEARRARRRARTADGTATPNGRRETPAESQQQSPPPSPRVAERRAGAVALTPQEAQP